MQTINFSINYKIKLFVMNYGNNFYIYFSNILDNFF